MALLEAEFYDAPLFSIDPNQTAYNLGRRDAVVYLKQLRDYPQKENSTDVDPLS